MSLKSFSKVALVVVALLLLCLVLLCGLGSSFAFCVDNPDLWVDVFFGLSSGLAVVVAFVVAALTSRFVAIEGAFGRLLGVALWGLVGLTGLSAVVALVAKTTGSELPYTESSGGWDWD